MLESMLTLIKGLTIVCLVVDKTTVVVKITAIVTASFFISFLINQELKPKAKFLV
jgi:hypothetical protein